MTPFALFACSLATLTGAPAPRPAHTFAEGGKARMVLVTPAKPTPVEASAAAELQRCIAKGSGARPAIVAEGASGKVGPAIYIGATRRAAGLKPRIDTKALGADGIVLRTAGRDLIVTGGASRGVYYAACELLERAVGCRWWAEDAELIPAASTITCPKMDLTYAPAIVCREPHFYMPNHDGAWDAHNRVNGHFNPVPAQLGGHMQILGWCHTFYQLIPPDRYARTHPEWFSLREGKRSWDYAQLCLTNPELVEEMAKNALAWIRKEPDAGFISIAQNDWLGRCECPKCLAIEAEDGSPSGPLVRFVNAVAERIEREFPGFRVETLAYQYTRKAPRVTRPRKNVVIRLCSIECDYGLPLTHEKNRGFLDDLKAWSAISPELYIWTYVARFGEYWYPNPCLPVYGPNIRLFAANHAVGVFVQGDSYNAASCFQRLRAWVTARLLWDPSRNQAQLEGEFLQGYYGKAAPYMQAYLRLVEAAYASRKSDRYMTPDHVLEGYRLFAEGERAVASDPVLAARVRRERFPLDYLWATEHRGMMAACAKRGIEPPAPASRIEAVRYLRDAAKRYETTFRAEGQPAMQWLDTWVDMLTDPPAAPPSLAGIPADRLFDLQEGDMRLFNLGSWVDVVDDPAASNRRAARMRTDHNQWAVQAAIPDELIGPVHVYMALRAEGEGDAETAVTLGVYSSSEAKGISSRSLTLAEADGAAYRLVDLGVVQATPGTYVWASPANNAGRIKGVWIDRIVLVRE